MSNKEGIIGCTISKEDWLKTVSELSVGNILAQKEVKSSEK